MKEQEKEEIIKLLRMEYMQTIENLLDKSCLGCIIIGFSDAILYFYEDTKWAEEVKDFARKFSGREAYCGTCMSILWDIPRHEADGLSRPWRTHKPRKEE